MLTWAPQRRPRSIGVLETIAHAECVRCGRSPGVVNLPVLLDDLDFDLDRVTSDKLVAVARMEVKMEPEPRAADDAAPARCAEEVDM